MDITDKKWFKITLVDGKVVEAPGTEFVVTNNGSLVLIQTIDTDAPAPTMAWADGRWISAERISYKPVLQ